MENIFSSATNERKKDQEKHQAELELIDSKMHRIRVNFSLLEESKDKMFKEAEKKGISASALLQLWISEHCN